MATFEGAGIYFALDDTGGTARVLTGVRTVALNLSNRMSEIHAVGDTIVKERVTLEDVTIDIEGHYENSTATGATEILSADWDVQQANGTTFTFTFGPEGNASGAPLFSGESVVRDFSMNTELDGLVLFRASLRANTVAQSTSTG